MVAIRNLRVEWYGHCAVKQTYEDVFNNIVKVTNGLWVSLANPYIGIRVMEDICLYDGGNINSYIWLN
jgi:hypothetical protein